MLDINKDGLNDFIIGTRREGPSLLWYKNTTSGLEKFLIDTTFLEIEAGGAFFDIDQDGDLDVVFGADAKDNHIWWWENPYPNYDVNTCWERRVIKQDGGNKHHDHIFGDFDGDGRVELAFWNQGGKRLCLAEIPDNPLIAASWDYRDIFNWEIKEQYEGLAQIDDGIQDIIGGGSWFKYQEDGRFLPILIDSTMYYTRSAVGQLVTGGTPEIIFVSGDKSSPLKMYQCSGDPLLSESWKSKELLDTMVIHGHSLALADINQDGNLDIFNAEMHTPGQKDKCKTRILYGDGLGNFNVQILAVGFGNHESKLADLDGDGDLDILGKPYTWDAPRIDILFNQLK